MKQEKLNHKIFRTIKYLTEKEYQPKNTVSFLKEIDCTLIEKIRLNNQLHNQRKISYTSFIIKAVSQAFLEYPFVNARVFPGFPFSKIYKFPEIHTAVACEKNIPGAEMMAFFDILKNTDSKTIGQINEELFQLSNSTEENNEQLKNFMNLIKKLPVFLSCRICTLPSYFPTLWMKYRGSAVLISSPSKYGVDAVLGTWTHPIGISFGLVQKKAIIKNDEVVSALCFTLSMNFDRRIIAGGPAARFFNCIATNLMDQNFLNSLVEESFSEKKSSSEKIFAQIEMIKLIPN